ncbi:hypothetical protein F5141DRAFT_328802 [Pisolithus sp. B1]|nr:hypothetical protein F5141DRAFT_328802 [Pisolithus sp. B1]
MIVLRLNLTSPNLCQPGATQVPLPFLLPPCLRLLLRVQSLLLLIRQHLRLPRAAAGIGKIPIGSPHQRNSGFRGLPELERSSLTPTEPNTEYQASIQGDHFASSVTLQEVKQELTDGSEPVWGIGNDDNGDLGSTHSEYLGAFTPMPVDTQSPRSWSPWSHSSDSSDNLSGVLRAGTPLFNVFRTRRGDIPKLTRAAEEEGKHMCIIDAPPSYPGTAKLPREKANGTVWVLVSDREDDLRYALDCQQRGMPGTLFFDQQTAKRIGILEVVFASFVGGFIVALGFKYL